MNIVVKLTPVLVSHIRLLRLWRAEKTANQYNCAAYADRAIKIIKDEIKILAERKL